jgi:hypothetical protein
MMVIKHTSGPSAEFQLDLDRFYNECLSPVDRGEPAYRRVFVVTSPGDGRLLPLVAGEFVASGPGSSSSEMELVLKLVQALNEGRRNGPMAALEAENRALCTGLQAYERGHFMRMMRRVQRWRRGLRR